MNNQAPRWRGRGWPWLPLICLLISTGGEAAQPLPMAMDRPALKIGKPAEAVFVSITRAGERLVAVGERGLIVFSDDSGRSWQQADVPASVTLATVRFANAKEGWAGGNQGVVLRTRNGGASWQRVLDGRAAADLALKTAKANAPASMQDAERLVEDGPDKPFLDLVLQPDGSLLALGGFGLAFESRDRGATWAPIMAKIPNPDGLSLYGVAERPGQRLLFGEQGVLLGATDSQPEFRKLDSPAAATLFASLTLADHTVLLMGLRGKVFRSGHAADAWETIQSPVDASLFAGIQLKDGRVLLVGAAGQLLSSVDEGHSFQSISLKRRFPFSGIAEAPDGALVLAGARGLMRVEADDFSVADGSGDLDRQRLATAASTATHR